MGLAGNARPRRDVGEGAIAVVVEEVVPLAVRVLGAVEDVRLDEDVEPAVAVVVAEGGHGAGVRHIEAVGVRHLLERAVALVDVEEVRRVEPADIDVQETVIVEVVHDHAAGISICGETSGGSDIQETSQVLFRRKDRGRNQKLFGNLGWIFTRGHVGQIQQPLQLRIGRVVLQAPAQKRNGFLHIGTLCIEHSWVRRKDQSIIDNGIYGRVHKSTPMQVAYSQHFFHMPRHGVV